MNHVIGTHIKGIPCQIQIDHYYHQGPWKGSCHTCPSDMDWYGYTACEFTVLDRKGYYAKWLERKIDDKELERIEQEIGEYLNEPDI